MVGNREKMRTTANKEHTSSNLKYEPVMYEELYCHNNLGFYIKLQFLL